MEPIKERISIDRYPEEQKAQALMEGDIVISDVKPDMSEIIKYGVRGFITDSDCSGDKISFKGKIKVSVIYRPKGEGQKTEYMRTELAVNDYVSVEGCEKDNILFKGMNITDSMISVVNDRKLKYRISIDLCYVNLESENTDMVKDVKDIPSDQIIRDEFVMSKNVCSGTEGFRLTEEFNVPADREEIDEICDVELWVQSPEIKLSGSRLALSGDLALRILYKPIDTEELNIIENEIPINGSFEVQNSDKNAVCDMRINILDDNITIKENDDGEARTIECEVDMQAVYRILSAINNTYTDDLYATDKETLLEREEVVYPLVICRNKNQFPVKETVELDAGEPSILKVLGIYCTPICDNVEKYEDKAVLEGVVDTKILYIAKDDDKPVCCHETMLPYRQTVELKGLDPSAGQIVDIDMDIEHISWSTLDSNEIEIKPIICVNAMVTCINNVSLISGIEFRELPENYGDNFSSMTLYVVKKGDTLWKIAKKYNSSVCAIAEINGIENPDIIYPGDKLLIVK